MDILSEIIKAVISGGIGFILGRVEAKNNNNATRFKEYQDSAVKLIRSTVEDAVRHFSRKASEAERIASATLIKASFKRISTDANHVAMIAGKTNTFYLDEFMAFHEAVTKEPFEDAVIAPEDIDHNRIEQITTSGEALVTMIYFLKKI